MKEALSLVDFRDFRPTAILTVDLVKHSRRPKSEVTTIQRVLASIFEDAVRRLNLTDVRFNYTGAGYVVAFTGDASARVLDFINAAIP
ncbi:MAG: hypothetical protein PHN75_10830, partial [Syntrophales bacterium]|nr:hypothetical protein [Syntrophales bacterium]